jgi:hypothetical protein
MFRWLKRWLFGKPYIPDPLAREVIARAFNTGNIVTGNRNEDGTVDIQEWERDSE